jgi:biopolymer transport protein ExbD
MKRRRRIKKQDADLDITSFMNLMIVLVPVLLLNMVFSHITVLDLNLPGAAAPSESDDPALKQLELMVTADNMAIYYPSGVLVASIAKKESGYDYPALSTYLQDIKQQLQGQGIDKKDIVLLSSPDISYQTIVSTMDTVRSFKTVVVASEVEAELFPDISLGDAPVVADASTTDTLSQLSEGASVQ